MKVSVIIPSLNEAETIGICIERVKTIFDRYNINGEIIVADNSDDDTPQIARSLGAKVIIPNKRGYGYAYLYAFKHANGEILVMGDADGTYDFSEMPRLLEPIIKGEADMVIGSRFKGKIERGAMPWLHKHIGNPLLTHFLNIFFKASVSDANSGFRAIRRDALEKLDLRSHGMEFASEMIIKALLAKLKIREVPITYSPRRAGRSKLNSLSDGWRHLKFMLFYAPSYLYTYPGLILSIFGLLLMSLGYFEVYFGYTPGLHSIILGSFCFLIGLQLLFLSLFAGVYEIGMGLPVSDRLMQPLLEHLTLEKGAIIGTTLFLTGFIYLIGLLVRWVGSGFVVLPLRGEDIVAFSLLTSGLQIFFNSFLLSAMIETRKT
ncbi:MAG: glycosyltransferase family 2 protein [Candidatus Bathyarchaeia archaeon]